MTEGRWIFTLLCNAAGEAEAIYRRADATAKGIGLVSQAVTAHGGSEAASLRVAEQYLSAFGQIAKAGNTLLLPAATNDPANMVAQAMSIYKAVAGTHPSTGPRCSSFCSSGIISNRVCLELMTEVLRFRCYSKVGRKLLKRWLPGHMLLRVSKLLRETNTCMIGLPAFAQARLRRQRDCEYVRQPEH